MWKNIVLIVYTLIFIILVLLFALGKLVWVRPISPVNSDDRIAISDLEKAFQISQPKLFEIGDEKLICTPYATVHGKDYKITYNFYEYVDGKLIAVEYTNNQN